jgi:hypothetical protein
VATHFSVVAPTSVFAGTALFPPVTVTALDQFGNTATGYAGMVHFTSSDAQASLPANTTLTNGTGSFNNVILKTAGPQTITATDTVTSSITGTSNTVTVLPIAADHFVVTTPANATAGSSFSFTVTAKDPFGNTAPTYMGTVHFTSSDGQAVLPADSTLTNGTGTFNATFKTAGNQTITATDTVTATITGTSNTTTVAPAAATHFTVMAPGTATAGTAFNVTVTALDQFGNTATGYAGTVHFTSTDTQATLPANSTLTNGVGTFSVKLGTVGGQMVIATDTVDTTITGSSGTITVSPGAATHFMVTAPGTSAAGSPFTFTVKALDAFNNTATGYAGMVHFTSSDAQATLPADSTLASGMGTFTATLKTAGGQTITATDTVTSSITGTSNTVTVTPLVATHLGVTAPANATAGTAFNFMVKAEDQFGNTDPSYTGTVHFTSTDPTASLPSNSMLTNGVGTFSATMREAGNQSITATDTANPNITGTSPTFTVAPAAATHFTVTAPSTTTAGTSISVTVTAFDQFDNTATTYTGTVHFTSTDANATLPANSTLTNGTGTFNVTLKTAGNQTVTATDTVNASITGTSNNVTVSPGAATHFGVTTPTSATAGNAFTFTVTAQDAFNNTATGYTGTVHFTSTDANATLPSNTTLTNGTGTFGATFRTSGNQTITAIDTVTSTITGTSNVTAVAATAATHFKVTAPTTATAGTAFSITVTAQDPFNNTATGYTGTVHFTSTDANAALPANTTLTNGTGTFNVTLKTAGTQTVTATDTVTATITGTSNSITVSPGAATHFTVTAPSTATGGTSFSFTVTALDANNNTATGYTGTVHFTSSDTSATLPANSTLTNGTGTFSATLKSAGNQTITATDTATSSITGTSGPIAVAVGAATHFTVTAPGSAIAGGAFTFFVTALDASNNTVTNYSGTVHFTSTDGQATLPADTTLTNGTGSFSATYRTAGSQTITATDTVTRTITGTSNSTAVSAAPATHFMLSAPASATAGTPFTFTVTALDQFNNTVTGYPGTVRFSSSDAQATLPANSTLTNGVGTFTATLRTNGAQSLTATDVSNSALTGTSTAISVSGAAAGATHFAVSAPASATAGTPFTFTVTALDANNNTVTGYAGTVHFTSSDGSASLPANATLTNGVGTFTATLNTAGSQTIQATDTVNGSITGTSGAIAVTSKGPPSNSAFVMQVYLDLLNRPAEDFGLLVFTSALDQGRATRYQVVQAVENSTEYRTIVIQGLYQQLLHRQADPSGLSSYLAFMAGGGTAQQVEISILSSPEFFLLQGGGTNQGFLTAMYQDVLGRAVDASAAAAFGQFLDSGGSRNFLASFVVNSQESVTDLVSSHYPAYLNRAIDASGLSTWVGYELQGNPDADVIAAIIASAEFFNDL